MHHHNSFVAFIVIFVLFLLVAAVLSPAVRRLSGRITGSLVTGAAAAGLAVVVLDHNCRVWRTAIAARHLGAEVPYVWGAAALAVAIAVFAALTSRAGSPAIRARREDDDWRRTPARRRAGAGR